MFSKISGGLRPSRTQLRAGLWPRTDRRRAFAAQVRAGLAGAVVLLASACAFAQSAGLVRITGTGSATGGMQLLAKAYVSANPGARVEVLPALGSAGGISALLEGKIEVAVSNRSPSEAEMARQALQSVEYARTAFVIAAHRDVGVSAVTGAELAAMYAEGAATFPNGKRARPVLRLSDATDTRLIKAMGPAVSAALDNAHSRRGMLNGNTDTDTADLIEKTPGAFGPSSLALIASESRPLVALAIDGKAPTNANVASGDYPWFKPMFLVTGAQPSAETQRFVAFARSAAGRRILESHGHLSR